MSVSCQTSRHRWNTARLCTSGFSTSILASAGFLSPTYAGTPTTTIGGHIYRFPPDTFDMQAGNVGTTGEIFLLVVWPDLRGLTTSEGLQSPPPGQMEILGSSATAKDGDAAPQALLERSLWKTMTGALSDRNFEVPLHVAPAPSTAPSAGPVPQGLTKLRSEPAYGHQKDVFAQGSLQNPSEVVICSRTGDPDRFAACEQYFIASNLLMKISYRRNLVAQWRNIEARVRRFLDTHEVRQ